MYLQDESVRRFTCHELQRTRNLSHFLHCEFLYFVLKYWACIIVKTGIYLLCQLITFMGCERVESKWKGNYETQKNR